MQVLGFSINTLTLFGLVLAIGLVVDDAIVVVENVIAPASRRRRGTAREAAHLRHGRGDRPIIATPLVLMAVFVPWDSRRHGRAPYQRFALTIAVSVALSAVMPSR